MLRRRKHERSNWGEKSAPLAKRNYSIQLRARKKKKKKKTSFLLKLKLCRTLVEQTPIGIHRTQSVRAVAVNQKTLSAHFKF